MVPKIVLTPVCGCMWRSGIDITLLPQSPPTHVTHFSVYMLVYCVYICACVYMCVHVHMHMCVFTHGGPGLTLGVFLNCSPLYPLRQGSLTWVRAYQYD